MSAPSLYRQLTALNAEIEHRKRETESAVRAGRMKPSERAYIIESLEAAGDTFRWLLRVEPHLKQRLFNDDKPPVGGCW
ncbi:hypothetical protein [Methylopila sp. M107]|uniref:hypothetical protein n=1 Tax=Methylopila sp. M107 TaxID=1101190 RepID=UPI0003820166|nr:hypothetical protein [Methylopila sp. M107]